MDYEIDKHEAQYIAESILSGKLTSDALVQRISRALKGEELQRYLTLKVAQALVSYEKKVK
ncbi:MAG: hypothetical protein GY928_25050 [Colwellia sp.]|nr:hypothetical protein [Colwellia sp.]